MVVSFAINKVVSFA